MKQTSILDENATDVYTVLPNVKKGVPDDRKANIELYNEDNMTLMKRYPDNYFDLAIVDPPYGINASEMTMGSGKNKKWSKGKKWDSEVPSDEYFTELQRVSKHQIIWGGNYFKLPISRGWIFWDKGINGDCSFADGELAWTSFDTVLRKIDVRYKGFLGADKVRIHPTQKPIKLYGHLINNYCKKGFKVLDTHLGSGSIAIACHKYGIDLVGCEIDKEYYNNALKRLETEQAQQSLF